MKRILLVSLFIVHACAYECSSNGTDGYKNTNAKFTKKYIIENLALTTKRL